MLGEQIKGIANHIIVGLLIDNKIIRLLYPLADEVEKLEEHLELVETGNLWMRREVERVGRALFTGTKTGYVGTEEDLHAIGQTVEGVCDTNSQLMDILEAARNEVDNCPFCQRGMECKTTHYKLREAIGKLWKEN